MYPVSDRFLAALRESHTVISRVDLYSQDTLVIGDIPVLDGEVTDDCLALIRRRCSLTLPGTDEILDLLPQVPPVDGGLWPLGNELKLWSGIQFDDGTEELVPLGVFRIAKPIISEETEVSVSIEAYDRSRAVSRAKFTDTYTIRKGTNYSTAILNLIQSRLPWLDQSNYRFISTTHVTPQLVFTPEDDPWEMANNMASSLGMEVFFDGDGVCVLQLQSDPAHTQPVFEYHEGEDATLVSLGRDLDDEEAYNGVILTVENTDIPRPLRAEVWDTDPSSPTYYDPIFPELSTYGSVPFLDSSQYITTQTQANESARATLTRVSGVMERIEFTAFNNPAHSSCDVISIRRTSLGVDDIYILDSVKTVLGVGGIMSGITRKRRVM